jgi:hypothetical protein
MAAGTLPKVPYGLESLYGLYEGGLLFLYVSSSACPHMPQLRHLVGPLRGPAPDVKHQQQRQQQASKDGVCLIASRVQR